MKEKQKNELRSGVRSVEGDLYESGLEVIERKVRRLEDAKLYVGPDDPDEGIHTAMLIMPDGTSVVLGWIMTKEARREEWWNDDGDMGPGFYVPPDHLRAPEELPEIDTAYKTSSQTRLGLGKLRILKVVPTQHSGTTRLCSAGKMLSREETVVRLDR